MKQFPFAHTIEMTHRLQDGALQVQTKITNMAAERMPVAIGFHPYYQLTDSPREDWTVTIPAKTRWLLSGVKVPTGETEPADKIFPNGKGQLKDYNLDDVFGDLQRDAQGRAHVFLKADVLRTEVLGLGMDEGRAQRMEIPRSRSHADAHAERNGAAATT